ncbi:SDR family NAD(P)-dependent oxidoreductase [Bacillus sp. FJAT-42315]|uniref:SDR family NAD(P)-dependent oxidoreductase n=1 Tax=Bacillus sp. FJAT-42315 TaxID=2014077 RepID=UPI001E5A4E37|nr:SDR family NAD(P)-dependent oxidoreductase [Bacillus sp. FJAT-42315]
MDILIHNAAYLNHGEKEYKLSPEHIELSFATNTFGPFLMTRLLVDHLAKSSDPRILHACTTNIKHFFDPKPITIFTFVLRMNLTILPAN